MGQIFSLITSFLIGVLIARKLGPDNYGILNYSISLVTILGIFFCFGINSVFVIEFIKNPDKETELLGTFGTIKLVGGFLTLISGVVISLLLNFDRLTTWLIATYSVTYIFQAIDVIGLLFQAKVQSKKISISQITGNSISLLLKIAWLGFSSNLFLLVAIYILDIVFNGIFLIYYYRQSGNKLKLWKFNLARAKKIIATAWPIMFSGLAILAILKIDQVIIGLMLDKTAVGLYAVADRLTEVWDFIPRMICLSLFPAIINAQKTDELVYRKRLKRLYWLMFWLSIAILLGNLIIAKPLINLLLGPSYGPSINLLRIYSFSLPGLFLFTALNQYLLAENKEKTIFIANFSGLIINLSLNILLIPRVGLPGAALATVITFIFLPIFMLFSSPKKSEIKL